MRISTHGNDLLLTDQSLGLGAFLVTLGAFFLVSALSQFFGDDPFALMPFVFVAIGAFAIRAGMVRLVATQLIIDPDDKMVITRRWSVLGTDVQRIPFDAVLGFDIVPPGKDKGTVLMIKTTRGDVLASGGGKAVRAAWEDVIAAVEEHMNPDKPDTQTVS